MAEEKAEKSWIMVRSVPVSFPDVFEAKQYQGEGDFRYAATVLITPGSENDKLVRAAIKKAAVKAWAAKADSTLKGIEGQAMKYCYLDGNTKEYVGYAGKWALSAKRSQKSGPPSLLSRDGVTPITAAEGKFYSGAIVNAKLELWGQANGKGAPGMRCTLIGLQFVCDGEAFGGARPADGDGFESVEVDAEEVESLV